VGVSYLDPDSAINGDKVVRLYNTNNVIGVPLAEQIIQSSSGALPEHIEFNGLTGSHDYTVILVAKNSNIGNGIVAETILSSLNITTLNSTDVTIDSVMITNLTTSSATIDNSLFSGNGLVNISSGSLIATNINSINDRHTIILTTNQINQIKAGQLLTPVILSSLNPNSNYTITYQFKNSGGTDLDSYYSPSVETMKQF